MASRVESRAITVDGRTRDAFVFGYSARRMLLAAVGSAIFAVIGMVLLLTGDGEQRFWGGACALLFGAGTVLAAASVQRPGFVALTQDGIVAESRFGRMFTPWSAVTGVDRTWIGRNEMLVVNVSDPTLIRTSRGIGWMKALNATARLPDLAFPTLMLGSNADALEVGLRLYGADASRREHIGTAGELRGLTGTDDLRAPRASRSRPWRAPRVASALLWLVGLGGLLLSALSVLDLADAERPSSRLLGAGMFAAVSLTATGSAWLLGRRPRAGKVLGLVAAVGLLLLGWILTTRAATSASTVTLGLLLIGGGAIVAWQLLRWHPRTMAEGDRAGSSLPEESRG